MKSIVELFNFSNLGEFLKRDQPTLNDADDTFQYLHSVYDPNDVSRIEKFYVLFLDEENKVSSTHLLGTGDSASVAINFYEFVGLLINEKPKQIIATHNHPSGLTDSSKQDRNLTKVLQKICSNGNIKFVDHIIYSRNVYYSFAKNNKLGIL